MTAHLTMCGVLFGPEPRPGTLPHHGRQEHAMHLVRRSASPAFQLLRVHREQEHQILDLDYLSNEGGTTVPTVRLVELGCCESEFGAHLRDNGKRPPGPI